MNINFITAVYNIKNYYLDQRHYRYVMFGANQLTKEEIEENKQAAISCYKFDPEFHALCKLLYQLAREDK